MIFRFISLVSFFIFMVGCTSNGRQFLTAPERATNFTRNALLQDACPYGVFEGGEKIGTRSDSSYEYSTSNRRGIEEQLRYRQSGFKDQKCKPSPTATPPTPTVSQPQSPILTEKTSLQAPASKTNKAKKAKK